MARIFTIDFEFQGVQYEAIVSTWNDDLHCDGYQVAFFDDMLFHLVPNGVIRFCPSEVHDGVAANDRDALIHCLKHTVAGYLQKVMA